jgi:hypothetical protein
MNEELLKKIQSLIDDYENTLKDIDKRAKESKDRAYGGYIRSTIGKLVERLAKRLIEIAWEELGNQPKKLSLPRKTVKLPIKDEYIARVKNPDVQSFINEHKNKFYFPLKTDIHVYVDGQFKIAVECKAYTENAMLKRILVDFTFFKQVYPDLKFVLFQLESQLGGDYSSANDVKYGSFSTHTLLSYFDIDLNIITLLQGERKVDRPIHNEKYHKELTKDSLLKALDVFKSLLK